MPSAWMTSALRNAASVVAWLRMDFSLPRNNALRVAYSFAARQSITIMPLSANNPMKGWIELTTTR